VTKEPSADNVVGCPVGASSDFGDAVPFGEQDTVTSHHFGEEGAKLTYGSYLRLEQLLSAQVLESDPPAHDELLFITIHQVYELWFKQLLHEVDAATAAMFEGRLWWAKHLLKRVATIEDVLIRQIAVLETMTPQDFLVFRELLSPASGFSPRSSASWNSPPGPRTRPISSGSAA
jgi:tryptophan 2,3-dioxygenase